MKLRNILKEYIGITLGTAVVAIAVYFFMLPSHVSVGSVSALAMVLSNFIPLNIPVISMVLNLALSEVGSRLRIYGAARRQPELRMNDDLSYGDLRLDKTSFQLSCGERSVRLSRKEFDLLELLMRNREVVITKETILVKIWGYETDAEENNVEVYISFLRKKLDHLRSSVRIKTIRMAGYCLEIMPN